MFHWCMSTAIVMRVSTDTDINQCVSCTWPYMWTHWAFLFPFFLSLCLFGCLFTNQGHQALAWWELVNPAFDKYPERTDNYGGILLTHSDWDNQSCFFLTENCPDRTKMQGQDKIKMQERSTAGILQMTYSLLKICLVKKCQLLQNPLKLYILLIMLRAK